MKFTLNDVLLPEIILDQRGHPITREIYKQVMEIVQERSDGLYFKKSALTDYLFKDELCYLHFCLAYYYRKLKDVTPIYHVGREFAEVMAGATRDFDISMLPDQFFAYFSIPKDVWPDEDYSVRGGFVYIGDSHKIGANRLEPNYKVMVISFISDKDGNDLYTRSYPFALGGMVAPLGEYSTIMDLFVDGGFDVYPKEEQSKELIEIAKHYLRAFINLTVFVTKGEKVFQDLVPPMHKMRAKERQRHMQRLPIANMCTLPVTFVSWNYKKPILFSKDKTQVRSFGRWQRCGPGWSQVKYIIVHGFERNFKNVRGEAFLAETKGESNE